jgi:hypothetical protein
MSSGPLGRTRVLPKAPARSIDIAMVSGEHGKKDLPPGGRRGDRAERLAAALRENLKRRKTQERGRLREGAGAPHDSAGIGQEIAPGKPEG